MAKLINRVPVRGNKSLELAMRDAMDGLADSAAYFAYQSNPDVMVILSIEPARSLDLGTKPAKVLQVRPVQDITEYLIQRELTLERINSA
jgi:hypothetical protein